MILSHTHIMCWRASEKTKNENELQRLTLFYQDMFIYSGKWQESQVFHRYVQRDINSSHLLHKAHSAGTVQGDTGEGAGGQRGHTLYTELKHTCFTLYRKRTKAKVEETERKGQGGGGGEDKKVGVGRYLESYSNTKEHVQIV